MPAVWTTHLLLPNALAGAGRAVADLLPTIPDQVRALIGTAPAVNEADPTCFAVDLDPSLDTYFWGGPTGTALVVTWYAKVAGVWERGPVDTGLNLSNRYQNPRFPWPKAWATGVLQTVARTMPPWASGKTLKITGGFPRNPDTWPALTVQVDEVDEPDAIVGDAFQGAQFLGDTRISGRHKRVRISLVGWAQTPEDRDDLTVWLGSALQIVCHQATFYGLEEPTFGVTESEDMEGAGTGVPIYIVVGTLSASRWSSMEIPLINGVGPLTVPRGSAALANSNQLSFP